MNFTPVSKILNLAGLRSPVLNALVPDISNYRVLLMQPQGDVEGNANGVCNRDRDLARSQFGRFLQDASEGQPDLVITPEYSLPWEVLVSALKEGRHPACGKLWALGCESIKYSELEALKLELEPFVTLLHETLQPNDERFLDPLAYVFIAPTVEGVPSEKTVVLVQFKTYPMGDDAHFEINGLQRGNIIYQFGGTEQSLKLVSLICSDAFAFTDSDAMAIYDRALVIHIQLNPQPRQAQYRQYRVRLLQFKGDSTELICLNWARNVNEWEKNNPKPWKNVSASAWYLRPIGFDVQDKTLNDNHRRGLYYTWLAPQRAHTLFLNFQPATYLLEATKVAHHGVLASTSRRRGPQLLRMSVWDESTSAWREETVAENSFSEIVKESGPAQKEIKRIADINPLGAERVLALSTGKIGESDDWYELLNLDSCVIDQSEIILRMTFCQDTDPVACEFRIARLKRLGNLWEILKTDTQLPPALLDFKEGFQLTWSRKSPHQNAVSLGGRCATVIYMGEESASEQIEKIANRVDEFLRRGFTSDNDRHDARQRLAVWFRAQGKLQLYKPYRMIGFDNTGASGFDLTKED